MTFEDAIRRLALAGRELGSGIAVAAERLAPDAAALREFGFRDERAHLGIQIGISLARVESERPETMAELAAIEREWRRQT